MDDPRDPCPWCAPQPNRYLAPGVLRLRPGREICYRVLETAFGQDYDPTCFNCVGPKAFTMSVFSFPANERQFLRLLEPHELYPLSYDMAFTLYDGSIADPEVYLQVLKKNCLSLHLFGHVTAHLPISSASLVYVLFRQYDLGLGVTSSLALTPSPRFSRIHVPSAIFWTPSLDLHGANAIKKINNNPQHHRLRLTVRVQDGTLKLKACDMFDRIISRVCDASSPAIPCLESLFSSPWEVSVEGLFTQAHLNYFLALITYSPPASTSTSDVFADELTVWLQKWDADLPDDQILVSDSVRILVQPQVATLVTPGAVGSKLSTSAQTFQLAFPKSSVILVDTSNVPKSTTSHPNVILAQNKQQAAERSPTPLLIVTDTETSFHYHFIVDTALEYLLQHNADIVGVVASYSVNAFLTLFRTREMTVESQQTISDPCTSPNALYVARREVFLSTVPTRKLAVCVQFS
eukprot:GILI01031662.1.p1 GENE.GILI01031662.1~~GILI01031662.1.p1  ORF type:complete len:514 (+),score=40.34 GILI01031662.1:154-1542(+)